jgi:very-short-patch-repair endonuclease
VDFFCDSANLIVEVDGPVHDYRVERDAVRDEWLDKQGYIVARFDNARVWRQLPQVLEEIVGAANVGASEISDGSHEGDM